MEHHAKHLYSIHSPIMTLLALEKGQLACGWRHFRMKKAQSCGGKLNCNLTCALDQLCLFMFRTNKRNTKKGKEKEAVTARRCKLGSASYTKSMLLMRGMQTRFCFVHWIYAASFVSQTVSPIFSDLPLQVVKKVSSKLSSTLLLTKSR